MNVHHLELFYYVAKHGGISAAVRKIPYGIQQPAVSGQMGKLEKEVGVKLFERSPFQLTPAGARLFAHVQPFFEGLGAVEKEMRAGTQPELRIGGAELVLRDHLPTVMQRVREEFPGLRFSLRTTGFQSEMEQWLREGQIDVAFVPLPERAPAGLKMKPLARLPLVLQVPAKSKLKSAAAILAQKKITEPLICLPEKYGFVREFLQGSKKTGVNWPHVVEATSLDLVTRYVANGDGIGLNVMISPEAKSREVRTLLLEPPAFVTMGALWRGEAAPIVKATIEGVQHYALTRWPDFACADCQA
ncbi:LysR family transcriptional regulator [Oleiharenicola lentus]|uniref:LysR family transcriptional regulator n=1 Tax=Oleiharenicola lentus TaxID=2508720 RepID=UPI003F680060